MRLGIDFDGVVSDTIGGMIAYASSRLGIALTPRECLPPAGPARLGVDGYHSLIAETHGTEYALEMTPIPGAIEALRSLGAVHDVVIVTARGGSAFEHTFTWLREAGVFDGLRYVVSSHGTTKATVAARFGLELLLDDVPENLVGLPAEVEPVLWSAEYNAGYPVEPPMARVRGWDEFTALLGRLPRRG